MCAIVHTRAYRHTINKYTLKKLKDPNVVMLFSRYTERPKKYILNKINIYRIIYIYINFKNTYLHCQGSTIKFNLELNKVCK